MKQGDALAPDFDSKVAERVACQVDVLVNSAGTVFLPSQDVAAIACPYKSEQILTLRSNCFLCNSLPSQKCSASSAVEAADLGLKVLAAGITSTPDQHDSIFEGVISQQAPLLYVHQKQLRLCALF